MRPSYREQLPLLLAAVVFTIALVLVPSCGSDTLSTEGTGATNPGAPGTTSTSAIASTSSSTATTSAPVTPPTSASSPVGDGAAPAEAQPGLVQARPRPFDQAA